MEANVKFFKYHSFRVMRNECLTLEELSTQLTHIKSFINSRTITVNSNDTNDTKPLTSAHFFNGQYLSLSIEGDISM